MKQIFFEFFFVFFRMKISGYGKRLKDSDETDILIILILLLLEIN
jgi:hypothetical protein